MTNLTQALRSCVLLSLAFLTGAGVLVAQQNNVAKSDSPPADAKGFKLKTSVNRVVVDVVVTDAKGAPVTGLTRDDFTVNEDNQPQHVLFFDTHSFDGAMDYVPPKIPPHPPNTFINLPATPERGPLYVLLYDLVNIPLEDQAYARKQLVKFIENKPAGARFAIFVASDGLHLVQGFTSDQQELLTAVDPNNPKSHVPRVFLMQANFAAGDPLSMSGKLAFLANYLDGLPGRKNLIWFAGNFPLSLFASDDDVPAYQEETKRTLDLLARDQIALYPVDVRGVILNEEFAPSGTTSGGGVYSDTRDAGITSIGTANIPTGGSSGSSGVAAGGVSGGGATSGGSGGASSPSAGKQPAGGGLAAGGLGYSVTAGSYMAQDEIARVTGGKAFYSSNDLSGSLRKVTEHGGSYYTLTYASTNKQLDGKLRKIKVELGRKGYHLAYRQAYYATDPDAPSPGSKLAKVQMASFSTQSDPGDEAAVRGHGDTLSANMEHGAPTAHQLIFGAHVRLLGAPALGTPEQMTNLSTQPAFFKERRRKAQAKPFKPILLQSFAVNYTVSAHQFLAVGESSPNLEVAAAAYDSDGRMLNATVNKATEDKAAIPAQLAQATAYRLEQRIDVPLNAKSIRLAVRDANNDRIGAMEIALPLVPEGQSANLP